MNRIRLLTEQVANQIAAGEVVERPASVVKELVENALDAQASRVTIEIQAGGRSLIRVTDDGVGMNRDDALLSLERHATSKISKAEDLFAIATMGFRGEALPSVASVCRMTLTTQERANAQPATQILIHGGKIIEVKTAGSPPGTCVEVRNLFFNLPARRKFLRSDETEYAHIEHYLTLAALAHPQVSFTLVRDGKTVWQLPPAPIPLDDRGRPNLVRALQERWRALSGLGDQLVPVDWVQLIPERRDPRWEEEPSEPAATGSPHAAEAAPAASRSVRIWGLIGKPGLSRATREDQHLFVNRRPVENRGLNMALAEGYHTALMKGRFPVCCLFLEIDPSRVDVNIHPAKREVKFHQEWAVRQAVTQAVRQALLHYHQGGPEATDGFSSHSAPPGTAVPAAHPSPAGSASLGSEGVLPPRPAPRSAELPGLKGAAAQAVPWRFVTPPSRTESAPGDQPLNPTAGTAAPAAPDRTTALATPRSAPDHAPAPVGRQEVPAPARPVDVPPSAAPASGLPVTPLLQVALRLVGVVGRLYVVYESDRGMVLMDQHAAHERILFEQMLEQLERGAAPSQHLLLPETVELSPRDADFVRQHLSTLTRLGVGLSEFGERTFLLDALPPFVKVRDARGFVLSLVDELKETGQAVNTLRLGEQTVAKTVCRHAVKANDPLSEPELVHLLEDLRRCSMPYTCPHGRPTLIELNYRELEKKFGRVG